MKIDVKEPSQLNPNDDNNTQPNSTKPQFKKGRPFGYYRKRNCVYKNVDGTTTFCGRTETGNCSSCDKIKDPKRDCIEDGTFCSNERCARLMRSPDGLSAYTDVCMYENINNVVLKRQPIPKVKTITAPRNVYNNSKTYKKQKYSYSITEMLRTQKTSYKEHQKRIPYNVCATKNGNCCYSTKQERCSLGCHPLPEDSDEE